MHCQKSPGRSEQRREPRVVRAARNTGHVSLGTFFAPKKVPRPPVREPAMVVVGRCVDASDGVYKRMFSRIFSWWKKRQKTRREALIFERRIHVSADFTGVSVRFPTGEQQAIGWDEVRCVAIETNDSGPWGADVWWLLEDSQSQVAYPQGATGDEEMLEQFPLRFAGFSHEVVIRAMRCMEDARFVCWEKPDGR